MKHEIVDHGDPKKYWTQIPNIVFDLSLKPAELVLYCHLKRTAGATGKCTKSRATLARETGMGAGSVSRAKTELEKRRPELNNRPLIRVKEVANPSGGKPFHEVTLTDIWKANMDRFTTSNMDLDDTEQRPVDLDATSKLAASKVHGGHKEEQYKEEPKKEEPLSPHSRMMDFLQVKYGPIANGAKEGRAIKWLLEHGYDPVQCEACFDFLAAQDWRAAQVSWVTVQTNIGSFLNGGNGNGNGHKPTASGRRIDQLKANAEYLRSLGGGNHN